MAGRPSTKDARREQILDAYETCIVKFGVEGATLERVAEEAGLARPLIRHNIGNRDELLDACVTRFLARSDAEVAEIASTLPKTDPLPTLIDLLFDPSLSDAHMVRVSDALISAGAQNPDLSRRMRKWIESFVDGIAGVIATSHPSATPEDVRAAATGISAIYFSVDGLTHLGTMTGFRESAKEAVIRLANLTSDGGSQDDAS